MGCSWATWERVRGASVRAIGVSAMGDAEDHYLPMCVVNPVQDPVRASASAPQPLQVVSQRYANPAWIVQHRTGDQLDDRRGHRLRQLLCDGRGCWPCDDYLVPAVAHLGRSALTASTPRTELPST